MNSPNLCSACSGYGKADGGIICPQCDGTGWEQSKIASDEQRTALQGKSLLTWFTRAIQRDLESLKWNWTPGSDPQESHKAYRRLLEWTAVVVLVAVTWGMWSYASNCALANTFGLLTSACAKCQLADSYRASLDIENVDAIEDVPDVAKDLGIPLKRVIYSFKKRPTDDHSIADQTLRGSAYFLRIESGWKLREAITPHEFKAAEEQSARREEAARQARYTAALASEKKTAVRYKDGSCALIPESLVSVAQGVGAEIITQQDSRCREVQTPYGR